MADNVSNQGQNQNNSALSTNDPFAQYKVSSSAAPAMAKSDPFDQYKTTTSQTKLADPFDAYKVSFKGSPDNVQTVERDTKPEDPWYKKSWDWANTPLVDADHIENWLGRENAKGFEKGAYELVSGFTSPISLALAFAGPLGELFGVGALAETGGVAALKAAGMGAKEVEQTAQGMKVMAQAYKQGKNVSKALEDANISKDLVMNGLTALKDAGMNPEAVYAKGLVRNTAYKMLKSAGVESATANNLGKWTQAAVDAGFTYQNAHAAVVAFPRVLDAIRDGDYDTAKELAVEAAGSGLLAGVGFHSGMHEAGSLMDDLSVRAGLKVKPSDENLKLTKIFGGYDEHVTREGKAAEIDAQNLRKEFKDIPKEDLPLVMNYMQSGLDETVLGKRHDALSEAGDRTERIGSKAVMPIGKASSQIESLHEKTGGSTFNLNQGNLAGREAYSVAAHPEKNVILDHPPTQLEIKDFINNNMDLLKQSGKSMGTWFDKEAKQHVLDIVETPKDLREAINIGVKNNQKAIFDLKNMTEIPIDKVGTQEQVNLDNTDFAIAKKELGENAEISDIAKRAQELKDIRIKNQANSKGQINQLVKEIEAKKSPESDIEQARRTGKAGGRAPIAGSRIRDLIAEKNVKNSYSKEELDNLLKSYDFSKLTDKHRELAQRLRDYFSKTLERAQSEGVLGDEQAIQDYVTQLWAKDSNHAAVNELMHKVRNDSSFSVNTVMARKRIFDNSFEGQLLGKKLAIDDPIALAAHNRNGFERAIAARKVLEELRQKGTKASDGRPMVALAGSGHEVAGENGENPAILTSPHSIKNIKINSKLIKALENSGDLDRLVQEDKIIQFGKDKQGEPQYAWNVHDYQTINHPSFRGWQYATKDTRGNPVMMRSELRVHPEAFEYLNTRLGPKYEANKLLKPALAAGREAKGFLLSFSPFHVVQEGLRAIMTGISPLGIEKWDLRNDPALAKGVRNGLTLGKDYRGIEAFDEGKLSGHSKILSKIPGLGQTQAWLEQFLFDKYIPGLKARAYRRLYEQYKGQYKDYSDSKVSEMAAADANERFGGINYKRIGRSAATQDLFRLVALAPDWLESEMRFMGRMFGEEGRVARRDVARMAVGMFFASRILNEMISGNAHNEAPFGVVVKDSDGKDKVYSLRTLPTDILHAVSDPGNFLAGRVSPLVRAGVQTYTGRDEYGRKIPTHNIVSNILRQAAPIPVQSTIQRVSGAAPDITTPEQIAKAAGATVFPYKTEANKMAAKLASDRSSSGPIDPDQLRRHQTLLRFEDDLRSKRMQPNDLYELVEKGAISVKEGKEIVKNFEKTQEMPPDVAQLYTRSTHLPMKDFLSVWEISTPKEKEAMTQIMLTKAKEYYKKAFQEMTMEQRNADPTYQKLRKLLPGIAPF